MNFPVYLHPEQSGRFIVYVTNNQGQMQRVAGNEILVPAPTTAVIGQESEYVIANHHFCDHYRVSTENGTVALEGDVISYTPATEGSAGFTLNGVFYPIQAQVPAPLEPTAPMVESPINFATNTPSQVTLSTSPFSPGSPSHAHVATRWQIATDANFTNVVHDITETNPSKLISRLSPTLVDGTTYFVRAKHIAEV